MFLFKDHTIIPHHVLTNTYGEQSTSTHNVSVGDSVEFILLKEPDTFSTNLVMAREASDSIAFPEDGSRIMKMAKLGDKLMVHRQIWAFVYKSWR